MTFFRKARPALVIHAQFICCCLRNVASFEAVQNANLWDTSSTPTIVMTQRGARRNAQAHLRDQGVEVVEFDFLTPECVTDYCAARGFLQCLWECGGTLAAPAIASGDIHKVMAFVAPKIIGGCNAYAPVGDLGNVEMTQVCSNQGFGNIAHQQLSSRQPGSQAIVQVLCCFVGL
jgi:riboflavin biosynthesis pyrimidine reductase